jgi:hypothetical protein
VSHRIIRADPGELLVHLETLVEPAPARVIVAEDLQGLEVVRVAADDPFEKTDFDIEILPFLRREFARFGGGGDFLRHTLRFKTMIPNDLLKSSGPRDEQFSRLQFSCELPECA